MSTRVTKGRINVKARRKRLLVLADWLESAVSPSLNGAKFNMFLWAGKAEVDDIIVAEFRKLAEVPRTISGAKTCSFAGCAVGWGLTHPTLRKHLSNAALIEHGDVLTFPVENLARVFGISYNQAYSCFMPDEYANPTLSNVVRRLRATANG